MDYINIENEIDQAKLNPSRELLESINESFIYILNSARKKVEGLIRNIPFSKEKEKRWTVIIFWKYRLK